MAAEKVEKDTPETKNLAPPPPQATTPRSSFFSRMSSLSSSAAPILEQVYDRAHKHAVALKETAAAAQDAVKVVRTTSAELAKDLMPIESCDEVDLSPKESSELSRSSASFSSEESSINEDSQTLASAEINTEAVDPRETRFYSVVNAYTEFRTTGRYHLRNPSNSERLNWYDSPLIVGGADKVAGLGRLKLKNLLATGGEDDKSHPEEVPAMPPRSPRPPKRSNSYYEEAVKNLLQPGQRALFFGRGTMGVILKPTYLASWRGKDGGGLVSSSKKGGVFIDALVPGGHAERSGVVFVGDYVVKIGNLDVRNYTLEELVAAIAEAERPNIMVLTGECEVATQTVEGKASGEESRYFVSALDLAFGYVNKIATEGSVGRSSGAIKKGVAKPELHPNVSGISLLDGDDGEDDEEVCFSSPSKDREHNNPGLDVSSDNQNEYHDEEKKGDDMESCDFGEKKGTETETFSDQLNHSSTTDVLSADESSGAQTPTHSKPTNDFDTLVHYASRRTNRQDEDAQEQIPTLLARAAFLNPIFRTTLHEAFKECCTDPRRANFLEHFFQHFTTRKEAEMAARNEQGNKKGNKNLEYQVNDNDATSSKNQRILLEVYIDLLKFRSAASVEYFDKEKLLETARAISSKILIEDTDIVRSADALPESVVTVACGGIECMHHLKRAISDEDDFFDEVHGDGFCKIRDNLGTFLSMQEHFLAFLVSDDCARMRAYLRGTAPFATVEPDIFLDTTEASNNNLLMFGILHLICTNEAPDELESSDEYGDFIKMDAMLLNQRSGKRITGAASTLLCPIFITGTLNRSLGLATESLVEDEMMGQSNNLDVYKKLADDVQHLWDHFVSPVTGALSSVNLSAEAQAALDAVRCLVTSFFNDPVAQDGCVPTLGSLSWAKSFTSEGVSSALHRLSDSLSRDYCLVTFPNNFRRSIFHEWMLTEAAACPAEAVDVSSKINEYLVPRVFKGPARCCPRKVLRQIELPHGLSLHLPGTRQSWSLREMSEIATENLYNADVAVVFGMEVDGDGAVSSPKSESSDDTFSNVMSCQRFTCTSLQNKASSVKFITPSAIPDSLEEYLLQPPFCERPFTGMLRKEENNRLSIDGWEVSMTNSMIPVGRGSSDMLYCVSLVCSNIDAGTTASCWDNRDIADLLVRELHHQPDTCKMKTTLAQSDKQQFKSPTFVAESEDGKVRKMRVPSKLKNFNKELEEQISTKRAHSKRMVGISLVSSRNVLPAMRHSLSLLYDDLCSVRTGSGARHHACRPLLDLLSVFSSPNIEDTSLKCILDPYISYATSQWVDRPLSDQSKEISKYCGIQLIQSLPPVPLALLFVTALLEQKIVFSSSRRSMLMSASAAIAQLLRPLNWTHLIVPHTPISMVNDLIHYPAPFILGLCTDEKKSASILRSLPQDVTLVDLDVGRVMLASVFVYDNATNTSKTGMSESNHATALRSQSLTLAEFLGGIFGSVIYQESWSCESPLHVFLGKENDAPSSETSKFAAIQTICCDFLTELIFGISSCCLWIDEGNQSTTHSDESTTIIFDEDRFINNKISRARDLREKASDKFFWSLHHFDIFLEAFLRTQSLSTLICSRGR